jgi:tetratricopeptide (TPR) repeat protein
MKHLLMAALIVAASTSAYAFGGDTPQKPPIVCTKGWVYSEAKKVCVPAKSGLLDDKQLYEQGRALALAGHYENALPVLEAVAERQDSMLLTMIGYAKRHVGRWDEGMADYRQALVIDPNNINTREYLGEAYAEKGKVDLAEAELTKIAAIAGTGVEQYRDLAEAIAAAK